MKTRTIFIQAIVVTMLSVSFAYGMTVVASEAGAMVGQESRM